MKPIQLLTLISIACTGNLLSAATLGYYRFEGEDDATFLSNSSGVGSSLIEASDPSQVTLPATGRGSAFPTTIPQTGNANSATASIFGSDYFAESSTGALQVTSDFTAEAFINMATTTSGTQYIVSDWQYSGGFSQQRGFAFGVAGSSGVDGGSAGALFLLLSDDGSAQNIYQTGLTISQDVDYYVGVSFDESNITDGITFFAQDLTNNGSLMSSSLGHTINSLHDATGAFRIGSMNAGTSPFQGFIDEVRISDTVLSESQLLGIPEPSTFVLLFGAFGLLFLMRRRH